MTAVVAVAGLAAAGPSQAGGPAEPPAIKVVTTGLDGPRQLQWIDDRTLVVAESDTGEITQVRLRTGGRRTLMSGLSNPQGVDERHGRLYVALGDVAPDAPTTGGVPSVIGANRYGRNQRVLADLLQYELDANPDGQTQFVDGQPVDTLSNPYAVLAGPDGLLVADAGANAVLRVPKRGGRPSVFFVPPVITTGACEGAQNNPGTVGCDSVPTGLARRGGAIYVSTLGSDAPGAARVYKLDEATGTILETYGDLTGATGVAVGDDGSVYVSELFHGAPPMDGPPPPGFDPSTIGRIVRIAPDGTRTSAQVTMPTGLTFRHGRLYASAWSVAGFVLQQPHAGQIVSIAPSAFE